MNITRINSYDDERFSQKALLQHGCFLLENAPCEVEIISDSEAILRGADEKTSLEVIEEFRFYAPHITRFFDGQGSLLKEYPAVQLLTIPLEQIQPSQFYVDEEKITAIESFIHKPDDIIIQVLPHEGRYLSLDGHTRLYYAVMKGWNSVRAVVDTAGDYIYGFVEEAQKRNIHAPKDMELLSHREYEEKWNRFCDAYFAEREELPVSSDV